jgi:response regulator RpfG family c-di-GMP phosphodiesterase
MAEDKATRAKVLFVDDEKQILIALRALFRSQYQVFLADSGPDALEILGHENIHVIVSDQRMPKMLGHEVLREAKKISPTTMRLLLTGYSDLNAIRHSINEGEVFRFINKPWDNFELRATLENAVNIALNTADFAPFLEPEAPLTEPSLVDGIGILVLDDTTDLYRQIQGLCGPTYPVYRAVSIDNALAYLHQTEIALLITDITVGGEDTTDFLKLLKQQHPLILSIILSESFDVEMAVTFINQAKVYRYYARSMADGFLKEAIEQGLAFYHKHKAHPVLLERQQVEAIPEDKLRNPSLAQRLLGRFKALRVRWRWFEGKTS